MLTDLQQEQKARIVRLDGGYGFQRKMRSRGIREGKNVEVLTRQPGGGPIVISIENKKTAIGRGMAGKVIVEVE
ncbi:MAG: ferrous iron transport protein A [Methanosarcinales archaeon]|nr:ferrous iron transport protein A [Methanosarcinales archaeon]